MIANTWTAHFITTLFFAASMRGYAIFATGAEACKGDQERTKVGWVFKLEYDADGEDMKKCCDFMGTSFQQKICLDHPLDYGCDYRPRLTQMRCVASPSFEAVPL